ncbi:MAG: serine/threonine protein kinase [Deltaproteobacteria bacterium]|nr:serine/threonine protein kinase [Deltaproteobacteria bacterium]
MLGRVVADFLVVGVLGSGGFGNVHHVLQLPLRSRPVQGALKRLRPPSGTGSNIDARDHATLLQRFESEADALASLSHPNIVRLLKAGLDGDTPYLVLELVADAETLEREIEDHVRSGSTLTDIEIFAITDQILNALEAAHEQGIVHRDIKPGNVMLQRVAGYDVFVRVLDFGLAKFISESSETQRVMGTLDYMAPEQLRGKDIGPWTDLYALGLLVLRMLTGRTAFSADRVVLVNEKLDVRYDPVRCALGERDIDAEKAAFLRRATAFDRHERYASVTLFRKAFHGAFQPSPRDRQRKVVRTRDLAHAVDTPEASLPQLLGSGAEIIQLGAVPSMPAPEPEPAPAPVVRLATPRELPAATPLLPLSSVRQRLEPLAPPAPPSGPPAPASGQRWPLLEAVEKSRTRRAYDLPMPASRMPASVPAGPAPDARGAAVNTARHGPDARTRGTKSMSDTVDAHDDTKEH